MQRVSSLQSACRCRVLGPPSFSQLSIACRALTTMTVDAPKKLHGRAFYESIGSPKYIVAPMVDQSEFAWRMLTRSFVPADEQSNVLAYTPMLHARLFSQEAKYRAAHFQALRQGSGDSSDSGDSTEFNGKPWLDGNPKIDRPLFVQFCANDPDALLAAAREVAPHCDAVDLNLGCPQGIARKGHYGAFLQEDQDLIFRLVNILHRELPVPVTAKIRVLATREETLAYARNVLAAGASILTVHGRRREQKGHLTGVADWEMIRFLRDNLPPETVIFANGNVLQRGDMQRCLEETGADGVMSAEGNLSDPALFARPPPVGDEGREYWRPRKGFQKDGGGSKGEGEGEGETRNDITGETGGWRVDAIARRYLDILHKYALGEEPPARRPLFIPGDDTAWLEEGEEEEGADEPARKKQRRMEDISNSASNNTLNNTSKRDKSNSTRRRELLNSPNLTAVQPHLFHLLRHFVSKHTDIRDQLARAKRDGIDGYEAVLSAVEKRVAQGLVEYERTGSAVEHDEEMRLLEERRREQVARGEGAETESSVGTMLRCKRPWWVAQPIIRPLPSEALAKGAIQMKKTRGKSGKEEGAACEDRAKEGRAECESEAAI